MNFSFAVINLSNFLGSYEYVLEKSFYNTDDNFADVIIIFPYMAEEKVHRLSSLLHYIKRECFDMELKIHLVLDQRDMLDMSCIDCMRLNEYGVNLHTKGDVISLQCGLNVQCDDLTKNSITEEELDDMFLKLFHDNQNKKNHFYVLAWDGSNIDDRLLRFDERLLLAAPVSKNNFTRVFSYSYNENNLSSYSLGMDKKRFDNSVKKIYIDEKELGNFGPKKVKK